MRLFASSIIISQLKLRDIMENPLLVLYGAAFRTYIGSVQFYGAAFRAWVPCSFMAPHSEHGYRAVLRRRIQSMGTVQFYGAAFRTWVPCSFIAPHSEHIIGIVFVELRHYVNLA